MSSTTYGITPGLVAPEQKRLTTLRARAAKAGVHLHVYDDEDTGHTLFIVSRWAMTRQLDDLTAAEKWLDMVTGGKSC